MRGPRLHTRRLRRRTSRRGYVLAITLWLMVIVVAVALGLSYDTSLNVRSQINAEGKAHSYYAALSGIERLCAELDEGGTPYTALGESWEQLDSDTELLYPEAQLYGYQVLAEDNCSKIDLNEIELPEAQTGPSTTQTQQANPLANFLTEEQIQGILEYRSQGEQNSASGVQSSANATATAVRQFRSVDDLLLIPGFDFQQLFGVTGWSERLSAAERFRQDWLARTSSEGPQALPQEGTEGQVHLASLFTVGARARQLSADGQPRIAPGSLARDEVQSRLEAIAQVIGEDAGTGVSEDPGTQGGRGQQRQASDPITAAVRVATSSNIRNWSDVWGQVNNNRAAVRLLADLISLPNDGVSTGGNNAGGNNDGGGGFGGGRPGGGGGRPGGGGGPGGGRPGGGGPGGGGPGGGRPGGGGPGGPGGGFPGGGGGFPGGGGGFPGGGGGFPGGGGGFPGGGGGGRGFGPQSSSSRVRGLAQLASYDRSGGFQVLLMQGPGGGPPGGGQPGGGQPGGGQPGGGQPDTSGTGSGTGQAPGPIEGAINLNTASVEVLMTLPGMTEEAAQGIVTYRQSQPFQSRGDLLLVPEIQNPSSAPAPAAGAGRNRTGGNSRNALFNGIVEKVTVVSDTFTVRALGAPRTGNEFTGRMSDLAVHLTAVIDRSSGRCRIVRLRQDN